MEEAKRDKALKQVVEFSFWEKAQEVSRMEKKAITVEKSRDIANYKVSVLGGKLEESDTKLAQALIVISARDRGLQAMRLNLEQAKQKYYVSFDDTECSNRVVIFEAWWKGFLYGWMAAVDAINLPSSSPFRDLNQVPLPEIPPMKVHVAEHPAVEEEDSPSMRKLMEHIESHTKVIDLDNLIPPNAPEGTEIAKNLPSPDASVLVETPPPPPISGQEPPT